MQHLKWPTECSKDTYKKVEAAWKALFARKDLGFLDLPRRDANWSASEQFGHNLKKFEKLFVLGMGGSGLGGRMLVAGLSRTPDSVEFLFDSHPEPFLAALESSGPRSAWLVISKSGSTLETLSQLMVLESFYEKKGWDFHSSVFVITEDKDSPLRNWTKKKQLKMLAHPLDVGGRFSVLSPVGLVPAAFAGVDIHGLREGALKSLGNSKELIGFTSRILDSFESDQLITVMWAYSYRLQHMMSWLQQLWAESLGKAEDLKTSTPLPSFGTCDQHSVLQQYMQGRKDKHILFFRETGLRRSGSGVSTKDFPAFQYLEGKSLGEIYLAESIATEKALLAQGREASVISFETPSVEVFGELIMGFEIVIGLIGQTLDFDAFNQPGVESGKIIAKQLLQEGF